MYGGSCCNKQWRKRMARKKINTKTKQKPYKGHRFLKSIKEGDFFSTTTGLVGKVISQNNGSVLCKFIETPYKDPTNINYWIGDRRISPYTNVKKTRRQDA